MEKQNYSNHKRYVYLYHIVTFSLILILLISSIYYTIEEAVKSVSMKPGLFLFLISLILISLFIYTRLFALKAQDRAIKAEENFRHYILTGKPLDQNLSIRQIIGLRFASDAEFPELAQRAIKSNLSEEEIKKAIKDWKGDYIRA